MARPRRRRVAWNHRLWLEDILLAGEIERVNPEQTGLRIEKREAGVVMVNDALESVDDAAEEFGKFAAGDEEIVDFEKNLEPVALAGELRLKGLGSCEIEGVIYGDGDLAGDALHELELGVGDALGNQAAEAHGAEAVLGGGEGKNGERADVVFAVAMEEFGEARLFMSVADHKRLLRLPNPAGGISFDRRLAASNLFAGDACGENMEAHDVASGIVEDERQEIEIDDGAQAVRKIVEQRGQIALLGDSLADFEQGFELTPGVFERGGKSHFRRRDDGIRHRKEDNTRVSGGSTAG